MSGYNNWVKVVGLSQEEALRAYAQARLRLTQSNECGSLQAVYWKNPVSPIADYFFVNADTNKGFILEDSYRIGPKIRAKNIDMSGGLK